MQEQTYTVEPTHVEESEAPESREKRAFSEPKLTFVEPELVKQGDLSDVTAGFFGTFYA
jgi:hypothetical protein